MPEDISFQTNTAISRTKTFLNEQSTKNGSKSWSPSGQSTMLTILARLLGYRRHLRDNESVSTVPLQCAV